METPPSMFPTDMASEILGTQYQGYLAETYVMYELAKRKIYCIRLPNWYGYDLLCDNGARVEVKSSTLRQIPKLGNMFEFSNIRITRKRKQKIRLKVEKNCDFFVLVGFIGNLDEMHPYIVPKKIIGKKGKIRITPSRKSPYHKFLRRWGLITNFREGGYPLK